MSTAFYEIADVFFFVFHTALVLFNTLGWMWRPLRVGNLITLLLTTFSWFFLGIWYGWGYCISTDWHWEVRRELGYVDNTNSYIDLLVIKLSGVDFPDTLVNTVTVIVFGLSLAMSVLLNVRDFRKTRLSRA